MNGLGFYVAFILGGSIELALDPLDILIGLLIGIAAPRWWHGVVGVVAFAIILSVIVDATSMFPSDMPLWWTVTCRSLATLAWAIVGWGGRAIAGRSQPT